MRRRVAGPGGLAGTRRGLACKAWCEQYPPHCGWRLDAAGFGVDANVARAETGSTRHHAPFVVHVPRVDQPYSRNEVVQVVMCRGEHRADALTAGTPGDHIAVGLAALREACRGALAGAVVAELRCGKAALSFCAAGTGLSRIFGRSAVFKCGLRTPVIGAPAVTGGAMPAIDAAVAPLLRGIECRCGARCMAGGTGPSSARGSQSVRLAGNHPTRSETSEPICPPELRELRRQAAPRFHLSCRR